MTADPIADAVAAVLSGELIVLPTDTVYGIAARPDDSGATARLFEAKGRPRELAVAVLAPSLQAAAEIGELRGSAERLARSVWPGAVTLVLPRTDASSTWMLGGDTGTIGVRVPRHPLALAVLARSGSLAATSANRSGRPTPSTCEEVRAVFADRVSVYLCEEGELAGAPSTVVDLAHGEPRILREGDLHQAGLRRLLAD